MAKERISKEKIYTDYLAAKVQGKTTKSVARKNGCSREWVNYVTRQKERKQTYRMAKNARAQVWDFKYKRIHELIHKKEVMTKEDIALERAMIREMYLVSGFDLKEIAQYTGKSDPAIRVIIWG